MFGIKSRACKISAEIFSYYGVRIMNPGRPGLRGRSSPALNTATFLSRQQSRFGDVFTIIVWPAAAKVCRELTDRDSGGHTVRFQRSGPLVGRTELVRCEAVLEEVC